MLSLGKGLVQALTITITLAGAIFGLASALYGPNGASWSLVLSFVAGFLEYGIFTALARAVANEKLAFACLVGFLSASSDMFKPALYDLTKIYNPDGTAFLVLGNLLFALGGAVGVYMVMRTRTTK